MPVYINGKLLQRTSLEAWAKIKESLNNQELQVYTIVKNAGPKGIACHEIEQMGWLHQTASARLRGLSKKGVIKASGHKTKTPSGLWAIRWIVV
jgi:DNA-binding MarR family transcriptional regulator